MEYEVEVLEVRRYFVGIEADSEEKAASEAEGTVRRNTERGREAVDSLCTAVLAVYKVED